MYISLHACASCMPLVNRFVCRCTPTRQSKGYQRHQKKDLKLKHSMKEINGQHATLWDQMESYKGQIDPLGHGSRICSARDIQQSLKMSIQGPYPRNLHSRVDLIRAHVVVRVCDLPAGARSNTEDETASSWSASVNDQNWQ